MIVGMVNQNRWFSRRAFAVALLSGAVAWSFGPAPLRAQSVKMYNIQLEGCRLRFSPDLADRARQMKRMINQGLRRLASMLESPGIPEGCVFWLVTDEEQMAAVLSEAIGIDPVRQRDLLEQTIYRGFYHDEQNVVLRSPPDTPLDWHLRLLFSRYAGMLIDAMTPGARAHRVGWLYAGFTGYLAWQVTAEIDNPLEGDANKLRREFEARLESYYRQYFDPDRAPSLRALGEEEGWRRAVRLSPAQVQAQSVLTYLYLGLRTDPLVGVRILRIYESDQIFSSAFRRATGLDLDRFEEELRTRYYPLYRRKDP